MKKTILGVALVVVFCATWWHVAGEAWQARQQARQQATTGTAALEQALEQAWQAFVQRLGLEEAWQGVWETRRVPPRSPQSLLYKAELEAQVDGVAVGMTSEQSLLYKAELEAQGKADAHFRTQASLGIRTGLSAALLLLVVALACARDHKGIGNQAG